MSSKNIPVKRTIYLVALLVLLRSTYPIHERPRPPLSLVFRCFFCDGWISSASCPRVVTLQTPRPTASTSSTGCSRSAELDMRSSSSRAPKHVSLYSRPCLPFACKRNGCIDPPARAAAGLSRRRHQVPASAPGWKLTCDPFMCRCIRGTKALTKHCENAPMRSGLGPVGPHGRRLAKNEDDSSTSISSSRRTALRLRYRRTRMA